MTKDIRDRKFCMVDKEDMYQMLFFLVKLGFTLHVVQKSGLLLITIVADGEEFFSTPLNFLPINITDEGFAYTLGWLHGFSKCPRDENPYDKNYERNQYHLGYDMGSEERGAHHYGL